jgi:hypothetical protein
MIRSVSWLFFYCLNMTVKEIFELRRAGRVEEAYQAILPMYRVHHGKYTSLAMFWCAADMVKLLLSKALEKDEESIAAYHEAEKIFMSMQRLYPKIYDDTGAAQQTLNNLAEALKVTLNRVK